MKRNHRIAALTSGVLLGVTALTGPAGAAPGTNYGSKAGFFAGGRGTAGWVNGDSTTGKVMQFFSPLGGYGGFAAHAIDGVAIGSITAVSYDFQVTTAGWTSGGGGSPRLVVEFSDGGNVALNPVTALTTGQWTTMDAMTGAVDNSGGTCGNRYQASWADAAACHLNTTVVDAYVLNDSGWMAPLTVQVDNLTLNTAEYSEPAKPGKR